MSLIYDEYGRPFISASLHSQHSVILRCRVCTKEPSAASPCPRAQASVTAMGDVFDLDTYNEAVVLASAFPTLF